MSPLLTLPSGSVPEAVWQARTKEEPRRSGVVKDRSGEVQRTPPHSWLASPREQAGGFISV
jgi:hypothetical protein